MTQMEAVDVGAQTRLSTLLITPQGVWNEYGIPVASQKDLREAGQFVPVIRVGGRLYHRRELLERWLDEHTVVTIHQGDEAVEAPAETGDVETGDEVRGPGPGGQGPDRGGRC